MNLQNLLMLVPTVTTFSCFLVIVAVCPTSNRFSLKLNHTKSSDGSSHNWIFFVIMFYVTILFVENIHSSHTFFFFF
jgi:hypothetical protein